jgi:hypothetical protein
MVQVLTKTPTKQYPGKSGAAAKNNRPFRFALTMALMDDGYFGTHSELVGHAWWDEYAVYADPKASHFGRAVPQSNAAAIRANRGWLGQPRGKFERVYDETLFQANKNLLANGTFDNNINGWRSANTSISRTTSNTKDGSGALRISSMINCRSEFSGASAKSERVSVNAGQSYAVAVSMRSSDYREVRVSLGNDSARLPLSSQWRRYVFTLRPTKSSTTALVFAVGQEDDPVWIDSVYLFKGDTNVMKREFDNGLAIANATTKSRTVVVGSGYRRIAGNQDPGVNDGKAVTQVTLPRTTVSCSRERAIRVAAVPVVAPA